MLYPESTEAPAADTTTKNSKVKYFWYQNVPFDVTFDLTKKPHATLDVLIH